MRNWVHRGYKWSTEVGGGGYLLVYITYTLFDNYNAYVVFYL